MQSKLNKKYFDISTEMLSAVEKAVCETEVVLDIGCGIVPMNYFRPKLHIMMEPWKEYSDIMSYRHADDKSVIILRQTAIDGLKALADQCVDSIFMLDVIEHLPKDMGFEVLAECERVARQQIVIFTTLGFMHQHVDLSQGKDGWGLNGADVQEHLSGWTPEDFPSTYDFYICEKFHTVDFRGKALTNPHGAFYAICNLPKKDISRPDSFSDIRKPLPIEINYSKLQAEHQTLQTQHQTLQTQHQTLLNSKAVRLSNKIKKIIGKPVSE